MGLLYENFIPGEIMIEKNKKLVDGENRIVMEIKSNISNLPRNLFVDDCGGVEGEIMIEKNKKLVDGENRIVMEIKSNISNLPRNLFVDDCGGVEGEILIEKNTKLVDNENRIIKDLKSNINNLSLNVMVDGCSGVENNDNKETNKNLKWNKPKAQSIPPNLTNAVKSSFNLTLENDEFNGATIDPNINDLSKKCENLTLHESRIPKNTYQESEDTSKIKKFNLMEICTEKELEILCRFLVNFLKTYNAEKLHTLNKEDKDSEPWAKTPEIVWKTRGHVKKNADKNRSAPFYRSNKSSATPSERFQLNATPNLTLTTNDGNRGHVYVQNNQSYVNDVPEQDCGVPKYNVDELITEFLKELNDTVVREHLIKYTESQLEQMEFGELQCNTANTKSQVLNIQCGPQPNILNGQYHHQYFGSHISPQSPLNQSFTSYSPLIGETSIGSMVTVNSHGDKSSQENFGHHSLQHNVNISPLVSLNHQEPFMTNSFQYTEFESMAALNEMHRIPPSQPFKNPSPPHSSVITRPSVTQQYPHKTNLNFPQQLNNTITKSISSTSPHKLNMHASQKSLSPSQFFVSDAQQHNVSKGSPIPQNSFYTQISTSPATSPFQAEPSDSCYGSGSPSSSSAVTSPGSPFSELDQDFSSGVIHNITFTNSTNDYIRKPIPPCKTGLNKNKQELRPRGEDIKPSTKSAEQTLDELSKTLNRVYSVQLAAIVLVVSENCQNDCVQSFRENLMNTINAQIDKKQENIWKVAIFVRLEFLKAPCRVNKYKDALLRKDKEEHTLLYIAAVERNCPLIARYIAETMHQVGFNPAEVDANGDSILHLLARCGDTHAKVLGELLVASDTKHGNKLFDVQATNKEGKSLLHLAASSTQPQITTIVLLINYKADTKHEDKYGKIALQYHLEAMAKRLEGRKWKPVDLELVKKLLPPPVFESHQKVLERLSLDRSTPYSVLNLIKDLKCEIR